MADWEWLSLDWFRLSTLTAFVWKYPLILYGILGIPILFLFRWIFHRQPQKFHLSLPEGTIETHWTTYLRWFIPLFVSLGIACMWLALARPQRLLDREEVLGEGIDILLAIDVSGSMEEPDLKPNRLEAAKQVALQFIKGRFQDRIGLVVFAGEPYLLSPLTTDYDQLNTLIQSIRPQMIEVDGTALGSALAMCINHLRDMPGKSKVAILLSDGNSSNDVLSPINAADLAKFFQIQVYTIAVGRDSQIEAVDEKALREIAKEGEGAFFRATDTQALAQIFTRINQLEKAKIQMKMEQDVRDFYYIYLYWAMVFLLIAFLLKISPLGNLLED